MCFNWWKSVPKNSPAGIQRNLRVCEDEKMFVPPRTSTPRTSRKQSSPPPTLSREKKVTNKEADSRELVQDRKELVQDRKELVRRKNLDDLFAKIRRRHSADLRLDQRLWDWRTEMGNTARATPTPELKTQFSENLNLLHQDLQTAVHIATSLNLILTKTKSSIDPQSRNRSKALIERSEEARQCLFPVVLHQVNNHHTRGTLLWSSEMKLDFVMEV